MKEMTETVDKYVRQTVDQTFYVSYDGKKFEDKDECEKHELRQKIWDSIKIIEINEDYHEFPTTYYLVENADQLDIIKSWIGYNNKKNVTFNGEKKSDNDDDIKIGDIVGYVWTDGGDYADDYDIYTSDYVLDQLSKMKNEIEGKLGEFK